MNKITTADCIEAIISQNLGHESLSNPKDWKRRTKSVHGDFTVREFENTNTGCWWVVFEKNNLIYSYSQIWKPSTLVKQQEKTTVKNPIFYVLAEFDGSLGLCVTDGYEFKKHKRMSDETPKGTFEELDRLGIPGCEVQESMIEFEQPPNIADLKQKLAISQVFVFDKSFQNFMQTFDNEECLVIPL